MCSTVKQSSLIMSKVYIHHIICEICEKTSRSTTSFGQHMTLHSANCNNSGIELRSEVMLKKHIESIHSNSDESLLEFITSLVQEESNIEDGTFKQSPIYISQSFSALNVICPQKRKIRQEVFNMSSLLLLIFNATFFADFYQESLWSSILEFLLMHKF